MASKRLPSFLTGLGIGAAIGLLVAPHRGEKTRQEVLRTAGDGREIVRKRTTEARRSAEAAVKWSRELLGIQRANLESAYRAGMDAYRRTVDGT